MTSFRPNPSFEAEASREYEAGIFSVAEQIAARARSLMPYGSDPRRSHTFRKIKARRQDGEIQVAIDNDSFGHLIEFGSKNNRAYAPLRRGVHSAGHRLRESPKT